MRHVFKRASMSAAFFCLGRSGAPFEQTSNSVKRKMLYFWKKVAHLDGESLNTFFEVLEDWERHLAHLDFEGLERDDEPSGP